MIKRPANNASLFTRIHDPSVFVQNLNPSHPRNIVEPDIKWMKDHGLVASERDNEANYLRLPGLPEWVVRKGKLKTKILEEDRELIINEINSGARVNMNQSLTQ